jgi:hypothetical protein
MSLTYGPTPAPQAMRGPDGPREALCDLLIDVLPEKTERLRKAWQLDQGALPDVGKIASGELPRRVVSELADAWVEVINPRMLPGMRRVDISPSGDPVYHIRYACRIYVWTIGLDWDNSLARRDHVTAAVQMALLEFPTLARAGGDTGWLVLEETWSQEYGIPAPAPNSSGRCWCSASLNVDVREESQLSAGRIRGPIGSANSTIISTGAVGPMEPIPSDLPRP